MLRRLGAALVQLAEGSDGTLWSALALFTSLCRPLPVWTDDGEMGALRGRLWRFLETVDISTVRGLDRGASLQVQLPEDDELHGLVALPVQFPPALFAPAQVVGPVVAGVQAPPHDHDAARLARLAVYLGKTLAPHLPMLHLAGVKPIEAWQLQQQLAPPAARGSSPPPFNQHGPSPPLAGFAAGMPMHQQPAQTAPQGQQLGQTLAARQVQGTEAAQNAPQHAPAASQLVTAQQGPGAQSAVSRQRQEAAAPNADVGTELQATAQGWATQPQAPSQAQPAQHHTPAAAAAASGASQVSGARAKQQPLLPPHLQAATWKRRPAEVATDTRSRCTPLAAFFPKGDLAKAATASQRGRAPTAKNHGETHAAAGAGAATTDTSKASGAVASTPGGEIQTADSDPDVPAGAPTLKRSAASGQNPGQDSGSSTWLDLCLKARREDRGDPEATKSSRTVSKSKPNPPDLTLESAFPKLAPAKGGPPAASTSTAPSRGRTETADTSRRAVSEHPRAFAPAVTEEEDAKRRAVSTHARPPAESVSSLTGECLPVLMQDTAWPSLVPSARPERTVAAPRRLAPATAPQGPSAAPASALRSQSEHDKVAAAAAQQEKDAAARKRPQSVFSGRSGAVTKELRPRNPSLEITQLSTSQHGANRRGGRRRVAQAPLAENGPSARLRDEEMESTRGRLVEVEAGFGFAADFEARREASLAASARGEEEAAEDEQADEAAEGEEEAGAHDGLELEEEFCALSSIFGDDFCRPWERTFEVVLQPSGKNAASRKKPWRLRATLPAGYPADPPVLELCGEAPNEIRSAIQQLPQTQGWSGGCFGIINAAKELAAQLSASLAAAPLSASGQAGGGADAEASGLVQLERAFFCFTNAPSRSSGGLSAHDVEVICGIVSQHPTLGGVVSQGKPGVLILEGLRVEVEEILTEVKRYHSKMRRGKPEMIERLIERKALPPEQAAEWRAFEEAKFQALDADFNKPRSKQGWLNKGTLKEELEGRGLGDRFNTLFGI